MLNAGASRSVFLPMQILRAVHRPSSRRCNRRALVAVSIGLALAGAACTQASASKPPAATPTVRLGSAASGPVLIAPSGLTLYGFSADSTSKIVCLATCTPIWPPLTVAAGAKPTAGSGVTGTLETVTRPDGTHQVTYNGLLLYTYAGDSGPGQTKGQGIVEQYGSVKGTWFVATPSSSASQASASTSAPPTSAPPTTAPPAASPGSSSGTKTTAPPPPTTTAPPPTTTTTPPPPTTTTPPPPTTTTTQPGGTWA
jgi:predicted lipoprotein with Yx(FWY)xxD motif